MTCVHLQKLYQLCMDNELKLGGSDLIHFVCTECGEKEVCPSVLMDEYATEEGDDDTPDEDAAEAAE